MDSYECKIKQILEQNKHDYSDAFSNFLLDEQNLQQLSKLVLELKNVSSSRTQDIKEPYLLDEIEDQSTRSKVENNVQFEEQRIIAENKVNNVKNIADNTDTIDSAATLAFENIDSNDHSQAQETSQLNAVQDFDAALEIPTEHLQEILLLDHQPDVDSKEIGEIKTSENTEVLKDIDLDVHVHSEITTIETTISAETEKNRQEIESVFRRSKYEDIKFQVENARVGQHYQSKIVVISQHDASEISFKADSFKFPDDSFYFDAKTQTILGEPKQAQELEFSFQFYVDQEARSAQCRLNVIADPRSLWKVLEPEAGQKFFKTHSDKAQIDLTDYKIIAASRRGRSHEHAGTFRDDDFSITQIDQSPWSIISVADGAGSAAYSREGSRIAVEIVQNEFKRYLNPHTIDVLIEDLKKWQVGSQDAETTEIAAKLNQQFHLVYYEIYKSIIAQIEYEAKALDVNPKLFSTTLLVAVICKLKEKTFISTFSVGDGAIAVYSENNLRLMNVPDGGEYAGQTKFLDRSIAQEFNSRLKIGCFSDTDAIMLMSDGISDPIFETDSGLANHTKWQRLYAELDPLMQIESADSALLEWMHFFTPGHHDDRTMAVLWSKH